MAQQIRRRWLLASVLSGIGVLICPILVMALPLTLTAYGSAAPPAGRGLTLMTCPRLLYQLLS
jgi:hypothetical protein